MNEQREYQPGLEPMVLDKAWAQEQNRIRDETVPFYPGRSWVTECAWAALNATTDEDREYFIGEIAMISEGAAAEVRTILKEGW